MPRTAREDYAGAWQHVAQRTAGDEPLFDDEGCCEFFLGCLDDANFQYGLEIHGYAIAPTGYRLLARCPGDGPILSRAMRHLNSTFAQGLVRAGWPRGARFRDRYRSQPVRDEAYLEPLLHHIHLEPQRVGLVEWPEESPWSSMGAYLGLVEAPVWLSLDLLSPGPGGTRRLRDRCDRLAAGLDPWPPGIDEERGWVDWKIAAKSPTKAVRRAPLPPPAPSTTMKPTQVVTEVCQLTGASRASLKRHVRGPRANPARRFALWALARETRLTQAQLGRHVDMTAAHVAKTLARLRGPLPEPLDEWSERWVAEHP